MHRIKIPQAGFVFLTFIILTILSVAGCTDDIASTTKEETVLRFRCDSVETRSAGYIQSGANAILTMGIYASYTSTNWTNSSPHNFMINQQVKRDNANSFWEYSPETYWPSSGYISFFTYAPYNATGLEITNEDGNAINSTTSGVPQLLFNVQQQPAEQIDLLIAPSRMNQTRMTAGGYVNVLLRHALTRICFAARVNTTSAQKLPTFHITQINLNGLYYKGSCPMDGSNRQWSVTTSGDNATTSYKLTETPDTPNAEKKELKNMHLEQEYMDITTSSGFLFLLPQDIPADAEISISYTMDGEDAVPLTIKLSEALATWQPGESIRFLISLAYQGKDEPIDFTLTPTFIPWDNVDTEVNIDSDPFLDVTDISTYSYDAAATRVYFYTNQSESNVYIDPEGIITATGENVTIANEFCNIAKGDNLSDGTSNFFFDESTHKGYFDLINYDTGTTGSGTNKGRQAISVKLHAGKLVRYISVQPVVSTEVARQDETRYIGTFHRGTETGERIVTWYVPSTVEWTATIESAGVNTDYEQLCIDRIASPDYQTNSLYSYSPRNPEGATITNPATIVRGKGRVYFRVGWKNTSPTTNRHARIKVTYNNADGTASSLSPNYIYCRQGENPEGLALTTTDNPFSVYNLMSDGVQADYPTQGGLLSQWGRPRSWAPIGSTSKPADYPNTVDLDLDLDVNICPVTYAYPDKETITALETGLPALYKTWGYYADGYFDRREISSHRVEYNSSDVASAGVMLYHPLTLHSVFMPTTGYRDQEGYLQGGGTAAGYWSKENGADKQNATSMFVQNNTDESKMAIVGDYIKTHSFFMRCVKILNPVTLYFDANGGDNPPRPISVTKGTNATVYIPLKIKPDGYWKDGYEFKSWNTKKNGTGDEYIAGATYPKTGVMTEDVTLYAQWKDKAITIDFTKNFDNISSNYIITGEDIFAKYTTTSNGTKFEKYSDYVESDAQTEKVYYRLEFSDMQEATDWTSAYNLCKSMDNNSNKWRLPRASELYWISKNSDLNSKIINKTSIWVGTSADSGRAWTFLYTTYYKDFDRSTINNSYQYRCVRGY